MDFTYIIYGENIYYLDENNVIFSIEGFHGVVREGFKKSSFIKPFLVLNNNSFIEGATPEEIAEANKPKVPIQVKNMKFRLALIKSGIMPSSIDSVITQMPEGAMKENIFTLWNFADYLERNDASLNYMAGQFNISQEQLDNLFILSDTL